MRTRCPDRHSVSVPEISSPPSAFEAGSAGLRRRLLVRLSDESGIALVMALGIMLVLTIALTSTIYLTSASGRHANTSNAGAEGVLRSPRRA